MQKKVTVESSNCELIKTVINCKKYTICIRIHITAVQGALFAGSFLSKLCKITTEKII